MKLKAQIATASPSSTIILLSIAIALFSICACAPLCAADDPAPTSQPTIQTKVPGEIQIARWDVILNDNGLESVDSIDNTIVHTPSVVYSAATFNADALRAALNAAAAVGGFEGGSQSVAHSQGYGGGMYQMQQLYFQYYQGPDQHVALQGNANGTETFDNPDGNHIHIKLDYRSFNGRFVELINGKRSNSALDKKASISYDGQLNAGDALAFSASLKAKSGASYRHIIVWEAFMSEPRYQQDLQMIQDSEKWCQLGPTGIRNDADIAMVWASQAKHPASDVSPKWEQKLEDGKLVRLTGITRTDKWLFCWWDADGQPIANTNWISYNKYDTEPVEFSAEVSGSADEWKKQFPTGHPGVNRGEQAGTYTASIANVIDASKNAVVGVPVGPWEQIGEIKKGGKIKVGNVTYSLRDVQSGGPDFMYAQFYPERGNDSGGDLIALSAVGLDGTEIDTSYLPMITTRNNGYSGANFQGFDLKNLKTFHVWKRKQQWVTFTAFATTPITPPRDQVTPAEVAAVSQIQESQRQQQRVKDTQQSIAQMTEIRKQWNAIPPDPTTPKGAVRAFFQSAAKGDLPAVRARMKLTIPGNESMMDILARLITATQHARTIAVARFGEAQVQALQYTQPLLMDLEMQIDAEDWKPRDDGGLTGQELNVIKGDDGQYYLDFARNLPTGDQIKTIKPMLLGRAIKMEQIDQLLKDNPSMTLDQFREALTHPATQPTTQKAN